MVGNATCIVENDNGLSLASRSVRLGTQQAWQCKPTEADASNTHPLATGNTITKAR